MDSSFGLEMAGAPKATADVVESMAGAICVDNAFDLDLVFKVDALQAACIPSISQIAAGTAMPSCILDFSLLLMRTILSFQTHQTCTHPFKE